MRVLVLGDALFDGWRHGEPAGLSREAPVPVIPVHQTSNDPGGAANTAVNVAALGGRPILVTALGDDPQGAWLSERLVELGVHVRPVVVPGWRTPTKRRVLTGDQLGVRLDDGEAGTLPQWVARELLAAAEAAIASTVTAMALCDYGYGALDATALRWVRERRGAAPVVAVEMLNLTGARVGAVGDSYVAALALATAAGAELADAARLAQLASSAAVRGPRTCVCECASLLAEIDAPPGQARVNDVAGLVTRVRRDQARGARVVFTNGCFDVLHRGHVTFLSQARALGDVLVVAVNSDASVGRLKGPQRPVNHVEDRTAVLEALSCVDHVVVFDEDSPVGLIEQVRPDVYVKGGDYRADLLPEAALVRRIGGEVRILDYVPDRSTSAIIERIRSRAAGDRG